jgi:hypothetical protein
MSEYGGAHICTDEGGLPAVLLSRATGQSRVRLFPALPFSYLQSTIAAALIDSSKDYLNFI